MLRSTLMQRDAQVIYRVPRSRQDWVLSEEKMPESFVHDEAVELLKAILAWWARGTEKHVARNVAIRWDEDEPRVGVDPDVCLLAPAPPRTEGDVTSVRTWLGGHEPPLLAIEVVSANHPHKDYVIAPDKYAASGTRELWVFDPLLAGPRSQGGPFRIQVWRRDEHDSLVRVCAGDGPFYSDAVAAHLVATDEGRKLRIASDPAGSDLWLTAEEAERAQKEAALGRVAELEAALRSRGT